MCFNEYTSPVFPAVSAVTEEKEDRGIIKKDCIADGDIFGLDYFVPKPDNEDNSTVVFEKNNDGTGSFTWRDNNDLCLYIGKRFAEPVMYTGLDELKINYEGNITFNADGCYGIYFDMEEPYAQAE